MIRLPYWMERESKSDILPSSYIKVPKIGFLTLFEYWERGLRDRLCDWCLLFFSSTSRSESGSKLTDDFTCLPSWIILFVGLKLLSKTIPDLKLELLALGGDREGCYTFTSWVLKIVDWGLGIIFFDILVYYCCSLIILDPNILERTVSDMLLFSENGFLDCKGWGGFKEVIGL